MIRVFAVGALFGILAVPCRAEVRSCPVEARDQSSRIEYPQFAFAAGAQGVVVVRLIYFPNGKVEKVELVSGPEIFSTALTGQLKDWTVKTEAKGNELCETLLIAKFTIPDSGQKAPEEPSLPEEQSIVHVSVEASAATIAMENLDPAPPRGWKLFRSKLKSALRRIAAAG